MQNINYVLQLSTLLALIALPIISQSAEEIPPFPKETRQPIPEDWKESIVDSKAASITLQEFAALAAESLKQKILVDRMFILEKIQLSENGTPKKYGQFLSVLKANGYTAFKSENYIQIVSARDARSVATSLAEKGKKYDDDEFVTDYITVKNACSINVLAALRPFVPQYSFMSTVEAARSLVITDTYANLKRIRKLIKTIDDSYKAPQDCPKKEYHPSSGKTMYISVKLGEFAKYAEGKLEVDILVDRKFADKDVSVLKEDQPKDYGQLLTQLLRNGFTAFKLNDAIQIINVREARSSAIPIVEEGKTYYPDEYVTDLIRLEKSCSAKLLYTLKPLVPPDSHITTYQDANILIISDAYRNVMRIKSIIKTFEDSLEAPQDCTKASTPEIRLVNAP